MKSVTERILVRLFIIWANGWAFVGWLVGAIWDWWRER